MEIDAELFAGHMRNLLTKAGVDTDEMSNDFIGTTSTSILKKLADEIRTLQTSVSVHDQFAKASIACYQRVMLDLIGELEAVRVEQDARISKIEQELQNFKEKMRALTRSDHPLSKLNLTP